MGKSSWIDIALEGFWDYVREGIPGNDLKKAKSVEELIRHWLSSGQAIEDCAGDHALFLSTVAYIYAQWHDWRCVNEEEDAIPHIARALDVNPYTKGAIFDPYGFANYKASFERRRR
jgi:hypothetical protein